MLFVQHKYVFNGYDFDELYELAADPDEIHNLEPDPADAEALRETGDFIKMSESTGTMT